MISIKILFFVRKKQNFIKKHRSSFIYKFEQEDTSAQTKDNRLNYTFGPRILTNSRKWFCLFQIEQNRP